MARASYDVVRVTEDTIYLVDKNRGMSVTNDAENVVTEVVNEYGDKKVVYRDSMGNWDELEHEHGKFSDFAPYRGPSPL
jgi:hypothetical protein